MPYLCSATASDKAGSNIQKRAFRGQFTDCGNSQQLLKYDQVSKAMNAAVGLHKSALSEVSRPLWVCAAELHPPFFQISSPSLHLAALVVV